MLQVKYQGSTSEIRHEVEAVPGWDSWRHPGQARSWASTRVPPRYYWKTLSGANAVPLVGNAMSGNTKRRLTNDKWE